MSSTHLTQDGLDWSACQFQRESSLPTCCHITKAKLIQSVALFVMVYFRKTRSWLNKKRRPGLEFPYSVMLTDDHVESHTLTKREIRQIGKRVVLWREREWNWCELLQKV